MKVDRTIISPYITQSFSSWMVGRLCIMSLGFRVNRVPGCKRKQRSGWDAPLIVLGILGIRVFQTSCVSIDALARFWWPCWGWNEREESNKKIYEPLISDISGFFCFLNFWFIYLWLKLKSSPNTCKVATNWHVGMWQTFEKPENKRQMYGGQLTKPHCHTLSLNFSFFL